MYSGGNSQVYHHADAASCQHQPQQLRLIHLMAKSRVAVSGGSVLVCPPPPLCPPPLLHHLLLRFLLLPRCLCFSSNRSPNLSLPPYPAHTHSLSLHPLHDPSSLFSLPFFPHCLSPPPYTLLHCAEKGAGGARARMRRPHRHLCPPCALSYKFVDRYALPAHERADIHQHTHAHQTHVRTHARRHERGVWIACPTHVRTSYSCTRRRVHARTHAGRAAHLLVGAS